MNIDGSDLNPLKMPYIDLTISDDGKKIAYSISSGLYIINSDGTNEIQIKDTTDKSIYYEFNFTPDGNKLVYMQDIQEGLALDLRIYEINNKEDISLFYGKSGDHVRSYTISKWNTMLFSDAKGVNLMDLNTYNYDFLHAGGDAHFSYDSTKITFMDFDLNEPCIMDLMENKIDLINLDLPHELIRNPILNLNGYRVLFQNDSTWLVYKGL
jgi:hypothetical protein